MHYVRCQTKTCTKRSISIKNVGKNWCSILWFRLFSHSCPRRFCIIFAKHLLCLVIFVYSIPLVDGQAEWKSYNERTINLPSTYFLIILYLCEWIQQANGIAWQDRLVTNAEKYFLGSRVSINELCKSSPCNQFHPVNLKAAWVAGYSQ